MRDVDIHTYFTKNAPQIPGVTIRAVNALVRGGINTMDELLSKNETELQRVRNMGEKSMSITLAMRNKYRRELRELRIQPAQKPLPQPHQTMV